MESPLDSLSLSLSLENSRKTNQNPSTKKKKRMKITTKHTGTRDVRTLEDTRDSRCVCCATERNRRYPFQIYHTRAHCLSLLSPSTTCPFCNLFLDTRERKRERARATCGSVSRYCLLSSRAHAYICMYVVSLIEVEAVDEKAATTEL